jgi:hypothetical protein
MKRVLSLLLVLVLVLSVFAGCEETIDEKSSDKIQAEKAERVNKQKTLRVGEPSITNFYEANQVKEIYEKRDNAELICYAYVQNLEGQFIYLGISKGYGVNASIQFSNPVKVVNKREIYYALDTRTSEYLDFMPQAEPNGLFMPEGLAATYISILDEVTGEFGLSYVEDNINVFEHKLPRRLCAEWSLPADYGMKVDEVVEETEEVSDEE